MRDQPVEPAVECQRSGAIAALNRVDAAADLAERQHADEQLVRADVVEPLDHPLVSARSLADLGQDVGVEQVAHSDTGFFVRSAIRRKSASVPAAGIDNRNSLNSG